MTAPSASAGNARKPHAHRVTVFRPGCFGRPGASMPAVHAQDRAETVLLHVLARALGPVFFQSLPVDALLPIQTDGAEICGAHDISHLMPRGGAARIVELSAEVGDGVKGYSVLRSAITVGSDLLHEVDCPHICREPALGCAAYPRVSF